MTNHTIGDLYRMKEFDVLWFSVIGMTVTRVPGGWLFDPWDYGKDCTARNPVFVPNNNIPEGR